MHYACTPTTATCPACHVSDAAVLYVVTAEEAAQHYVLGEVHPERHAALERHIETLWGGTTARVLRCGACGFCFADPYVAGDDTFYTLAYERTGYPADKWEFGVTLDALRPVVAAAGREFQLLEMGAGDGAFVRRVVPEMLPASSVLCTEYSAYGREQIEALGVECRAADIRSSAFDDQRGRFGAICLFQVLEHLDGLDDLFERFGELSAPEAHVFIAVPNGRLVAFNEQTDSLLDLPPNHLGRWTRAAFSAIASRHGWSVARHQVAPDSLREKATEHATYRYMRRRQDAASLANRAERMRPGAVRAGVRAAAAGAVAVQTLPALVRAARTSGLGGSQWVHLQRGPL